MLKGEGHDQIRGDGGDDRVRAEGGNDTVVGGDGADFLAGGSGEDLLHGGAGADCLDGGAGDDTVDGGPGIDVLAGGAGDDRLLGGLEGDTFLGQAGTDTFVVAAGGNGVMDFEPGTDRIEASGLTDDNLAPRATQVGEHLHIAFHGGSAVSACIRLERLEIVGRGIPVQPEAVREGGPGDAGDVGEPQVRGAAPHRELRGPHEAGVVVGAPRERAEDVLGRDDHERVGPGVPVDGGEDHRAPGRTSRAHAATRPGASGTCSISSWLCTKWNAAPTVEAGCASSLASSPLKSSAPSFPASDDGP